MLNIYTAINNIFIYTRARAHFLIYFISIENECVYNNDILNIHVPQK